MIKRLILVVALVGAIVGCTNPSSTTTPALSTPASSPAAGSASPADSGGAASPSASDSLASPS